MHNEDLVECSNGELDRLLDEIQEETATLSRLEALNGRCDDLPDVVWSTWLEQLEEAHSVISEIQIRRTGIAWNVWTADQSALFEPALQQAVLGNQRMP